MITHQIKPLGYIESVYQEKFGTPRQSGVVAAALATLHFHPPYNNPEAFVGLEDFSHIWILGQFHLIPSSPFKAKVRPPKLGGKKKVGVFASRSPFRENRISLTLVKIESILVKNSNTSIIVSGIDLVTQTPFYDIKPYIPYADNALNPKSGFSHPLSKQTPVIPIKSEIFDQITTEEIKLISQTLQAHPEPAYSSPTKQYKMAIKNLTVCWHHSGDKILITDIKENIDI